MTTKNVLLATIGLCEHCNTLLTLEDLPVEAMGAEWKCFKCKKTLTNETFGYDKEGKRIKWVGENRQWVEIKPTEDFYLGSWFILIKPLSPH